MLGMNKLAELTLTVGGDMEQGRTSAPGIYASTLDDVILSPGRSSRSYSLVQLYESTSAITVPHADDIITGICPIAS